MAGAAGIGGGLGASLLALGVLALDAAYKADSPTASEYYRTLAEKCDAQAETTPHLRLLP